MDKIYDKSKLTTDMVMEAMREAGLIEDTFILGNDKVTGLYKLNTNGMIIYFREDSKERFQKTFKEAIKEHLSKEEYIPSKKKAAMEHYIQNNTL